MNDFETMINSAGRKELSKPFPAWLEFLSKSDPNKIRLKEEFAIAWGMTVPAIMVPAVLIFGNPLYMLVIPQIFLLAAIFWFIIIGIYKDKWKGYWNGRSR